MTPDYDLEHLRQTVADATAAIRQMQTHDTADWIRWRLAHLKRELEEFASTVWPRKGEAK